MNGSLPEKSEPLLSTRYEPLAREAKMPKAQLSRALAVSYFEFQLDILTKLAVHTGRIIKLRMTKGSPDYGLLAQSVVPTGTFVGKHMVAWLSW